MSPVSCRRALRKEQPDGDGRPSAAAAFGDDLARLPGAGAGVASVLGIGVASVAVTVLRRRQARRLVAARVAAKGGREAGGEAPISGADGRRG